MPVWAPPAAAPRCRRAVLVQYGYRLDLPAGWEHTGGLPERRRSLLTRVGAPQGTDLIAVERTPLGYDAAAEPERAAAEMRAVFDRVRRGGCPAVGLRRGRGRRTVRHDLPAAGTRRRRRRVVRRARRRRPAVRRLQAHPGRHGRGAGGVRRRRRIGPARLTARSHLQTVPPNRHGPPVRGCHGLPDAPDPGAREEEGRPSWQSTVSAPPPRRWRGRRSTWPGSTRPCRASSRALRGRLEPLAGAWVGRAAAQFAQLMVRWDTDARSLNQALGGDRPRDRGVAHHLPAAGRRSNRRDDVHQQRAGLGRRRAMSIGSEIKVTFGALATAQSDVSGTASRITHAVGGPAALPGADGRDLAGCGRTGLPGPAEAVGYGGGRSHRRARPDRRGARRRERRLPAGGAAPTPPGGGDPRHAWRRYPPVGWGAF